jgi:hypothetical protein
MLIGISYIFSAIIYKLIILKESNIIIYIKYS